MANLPESATWETGIYQLEETDPVQGGPNGIDNQQGKQLANRTTYLKALVDSLGTDKLDIAAIASQAEAVAGADNTKWMSPLRVAQAIAALATIAMATDTSAGKIELATIAETLVGTDTQRAVHPAGIKAAIDNAVAAIVNASPGTLDTLGELAAALGNDPNFATSIATLIGQKQPLDGTLTALSAITAAANKLIYATGADSFALTDLSAFARTLLDDADVFAARLTLGLGDMAIKTLATDFASSLATNGYQKLPSGLIMQWGTTPALGSSVSSGTIAFPVAFPTAALYVNLIGIGPVTSGSNTNLCLATKTAANFSFVNSYLSTEPFNWFAIGY